MSSSRNYIVTLYVSSFISSFFCRPCLEAMVKVVSILSLELRSVCTVVSDIKMVLQNKCYIISIENTQSSMLAKSPSEVLLLWLQDLYNGLRVQTSLELP